MRRKWEDEMTHFRRSSSLSAADISVSLPLGTWWSSHNDQYT